ncbi:hypothetical protein TSOC_009831 [Tetrabaena socialis]|uniref:Uncharacterized protein n=1 Tax=Tetrabaena socialis TaxID=47790 RepID=A0A2J7ZUW8_9CHLO|nr:hypothetical protein TSOC_009831 [Tetrabaena socialis]|eukprot:PNH04049.1 hypothetical protein TSOC_009831 [Tetrabaena socialis]
MTPASKRAFRLACTWTRCTADRTIRRLSLSKLLPPAVDTGRFGGLQVLSLDLLPVITGASSGAPGAAGATGQAAAGPVVWLPLLPRLSSLRSLTLTHCASLAATDMKYLAASCPVLTVLHVHRGAPDGGLEAGGGGDTGTPESGGGLLRRPGGSAWGLHGLTFSALASGLRELGLHDTPPAQAARPLGLPPDAVLSLGSLGPGLRSLALSGAAATVDLAYALNRLVGLTRLELGMLPATWEAGGVRRRQAVPLSLARLSRLQHLALRLVRPVADCHPPAAPHRIVPALVNDLPTWLYDMLLTAPLSVELLHLDLPAPPQAEPQPPGGPLAAAAAAAAAGGGRAGAGDGRASRLAPSALVCWPELLERLLEDGMSLRRLQALRLHGERVADVRGTGAWAGLVRQPCHLDEGVARWTVRRVAEAEAAAGGTGSGAPDGAAAATVPAHVLGLARLQQAVAGGAMSVGVAAEQAARLYPTDAGVTRLPAGLRLHLSVVDVQSRAERFACWWDMRLRGMPIEAVDDTMQRAQVYRALASVQGGLELDLMLGPGPTGARLAAAQERHPHAARLAAVAAATADAPDAAGDGGGDAEDSGVALRLAAAYHAVHLHSRAPARAYRWLPYQLPYLYGLTLSCDAVDGVFVALLAAGLPRLRKLVLGEVELAGGGGGLEPPRGATRRELVLG